MAPRRAAWMAAVGVFVIVGMYVVTAPAPTTSAHHSQLQQHQQAAHSGGDPPPTTGMSEAAAAPSPAPGATKAIAPDVTVDAPPSIIAAEPPRPRKSSRTGDLKLEIAWARQFNKTNVTTTVRGAPLSAFITLPPRASEEERAARAASYRDASLAASEFPCLAPVVCQTSHVDLAGPTEANHSLGGCKPAAKANLPADRCAAWQLPVLSLPQAPVTNHTVRLITSVIVEVGTNKQPETASLRRGRMAGAAGVMYEPRRRRKANDDDAPNPDEAEEWQRYTVAVEPLRNEGLWLWRDGHASVLVAAAAAPDRGSLPLMSDGVATSLTSVVVKGRNTMGVAAPTGGVRPSSSSKVRTVTTVAPARGNTSALPFGRGRFVAPVIPLVEVLERLVPPHVHGEMLIVDAQGFDVNVVHSAGAAQLARFDMVIVECEELWAKHPDRLVRTAPLCTEVAKRITQSITKNLFSFAGCMRNVGAFEYNCLFINRRAPSNYLRKQYTAVLQSPSWPPVIPFGPIDIRELLNATAGAEIPPWLDDDADADTWPPGLLQLAALMPIERALEVAHVMCPTILLANRAQSRCVLHDTTMLRDALVVRGACKKWSKACRVALNQHKCNTQQRVACENVRLVNGRYIRNGRDRNSP